MPRKRHVSRNEYHEDGDYFSCTRHASQEACE